MRTSVRHGVLKVGELVVPLTNATKVHPRRWEHAPTVTQAPLTSHDVATDVSAWVMFQSGRVQEGGEKERVLRKCRTAMDEKAGA